MNVIQSNRVIRRSIITGFFEPELVRRDYRRSDIRHPFVQDAGMTLSERLHLFFDAETGADYRDGDEWFVAEYLFPRQIRLPDSLKGPDLFTTIPTGDGRTFWHHRVLVRYRYGRSKRLSEALDHIVSRYETLHHKMAALSGD